VVGLLLRAQQAPLWDGSPCTAITAAALRTLGWRHGRSAGILASRLREALSQPSGDDHASSVLPFGSQRRTVGVGGTAYTVRKAQWPFTYNRRPSSPLKRLRVLQTSETVLDIAAIRLMLNRAV
jgi:hypothetical protein